MFPTFFPMKEARLSNIFPASEIVSPTTAPIAPVPIARSPYHLSEGLVLRSPVVQATLGPCDSPRLAAAVSQAGGLGCLSVPSSTAPSFLRHHLRRIRQWTRRPVLLAFTSEFESGSLLDTALEMGFRHFYVFWWNGPRLTRRIHEAGGTVVWQVGDFGQGSDALQAGADVLAAQGTHAGGQVRGPHSLQELVTSLLTLRTAPLPIIAGGGLADRRDVEEVLSWGASAALLGTRFLLSEESRATQSDKNRLTRAGNENLWLDTRIIGNWPCAPRRRLSNGRDADKPALYAGCGLGKIKCVLPAAQIVRDLTPHYRST